MPLPKKLDCNDVFRIISEFFSGVSVKELASHFKVSRLTITRMVERATYKDCTSVNVMVNSIGKAEYLSRVDEQMNRNKRRGRGNKQEVT